MSVDEQTLTMYPVGENDTNKVRISHCLRIEFDKDNEASAA